MAEGERKFDWVALVNGILSSSVAIIAVWATISANNNQTEIKLKEQQIKDREDRREKVLDILKRTATADQQFKESVLAAEFSLMRLDQKGFQASIPSVRSSFAVIENCRLTSAWVAPIELYEKLDHLYDVAKVSKNLVDDYVANFPKDQPKADENAAKLTENLKIFDQATDDLVRVGRETLNLDDLPYGQVTTKK